MVVESDLKELMHTPGISNQSRLLLCLAVDPVMARQESDIRQMAINAGVVNAKKLNIAEYLGRARARGFAIKVPDGWELTRPGREHIASLPKATAAEEVQPEPIKKLRNHLSSIKSDVARAFVEEAVKCAESKLYRSAVVLSWAGAVSVLHDHVIGHRLAEFNAEALKRWPKWKDATTSDELAVMKEFDFLQVLQTISIIGKNIREELEACLRYRNACGHPSSLKVVETRVVSHIETLMANVFEEF
jgi:hypothetical protein